MNESAGQSLRLSVDQIVRDSIRVMKPVSQPGSQPASQSVSLCDRHYDEGSGELAAEEVGTELINYEDRSTSPTR